MTGRIVGRRVIRLGTVGSTMDEAARLAGDGEPEGTVVLAEEQTAGRGRAGRRWQAPAGSAVLCSVLLRPRVAPARLAVLPLIAGVAVAEAVEAVSGLPCRLKWPNDVWLADRDGDAIGRKVAGLLVTARTGPVGLDHAVVGIGINVNAVPDDLPPGATSLGAEAGRPFDRDHVLNRLLERLDAGYRAFVAASGAPDLAGWRSRAAFLGEPVVVAVDGRNRSGVMLGVADDGALLLERADRSVERVLAGDLVRGPVRRGAS